MTFEFVITDQDRPHISSADRKLVLSRSRTVGARTRALRQKARQRVNQLQMPDFLLDDELEESSSVSSQASSISRGPSPTQWWYSDDFCILDYSDLPTQLLKRAARSDVNQNPRRWISISRMLDSPLMRLMPKLSNKAGYLDSALTCVKLRVQISLASPNHSSSESYRMSNCYGASIQGLSKALRKHASRNNDFISVWYTTMLLTFFELLDDSPDRTWITHAQGTVQILEQLNPMIFRSEIDKDLLAAQIELMVLDATFSSESLSHLCRHEWQLALKSIVIDGDVWGPRSELAMSLWSIAVAVPMLLNGVENVLSKEHRQTHAKLAHKAHIILQRFRAWHQLRIKTCSTTLSEGAIQQVTALTIRAYAYQALTERCVVVLQSCEDAEARANIAASKVLSLLTLLTSSPIVSLHLRVAERIVQSIYATREIWLDALASDGSITQPLLHDWYEQLGREIRDRKS